MNLNDLKQQIQSSPAFILDDDQVIANLKPLQALRETSGCRILYSMKALPLLSLLELVKGRIDGISVSSLFEARLAKEVLGAGNGSIHLTTPGMRADEFAELGRICTHISFNSLSQYQQLKGMAENYSRGLRLNPKLSFVSDDRYDPCRIHSKLGVDVELLKSGFPDGIEGLHFHTVFAREDFDSLYQTVGSLMPLLKRHPELKWLNLGGGYLYDSIADLSRVAELIIQLRQKFAVDVYLEPGKAVVDNGGYLLTTVLDRVVSDGKTVLILDTSVNHHPEVFEYQKRPRLLEEEEGEESAILAGSTCLAGDLFGEYRFKCLPDIGERLVFGDVGAYSLIKANRFNGYNLPDIYRMTDGGVFLYKRHTYEDYRGQWCGK
ncbi:MAG: carboxynorspermidine decarboxylase [Methylomonas sp.]